MSRLPAESHHTSRRAGRKAQGRQGLPESLGSRSFLLSLPSPPRWCSGPELCLGPGRELLEGVRRGAKEKKIENESRVGERDFPAEVSRSGAGVIHLG